MAPSGVAWWPGGRAATKAFEISPSATALAASIVEPTLPSAASHDEADTFVSAAKDSIRPDSLALSQTALTALM